MRPSNLSVLKPSTDEWLSASLAEAFSETIGTNSGPATTTVDALDAEVSDRILRKRPVMSPAPRLT